ncbi:hypothetical protein EPUL_003886 [Erysiphe pulchra]|uniref:Uncharacterized protein n=1 Tax=Erysiphe pulchra TaxID=225359 RepID=A0A2S4PNB9_9PEZI|nr:hypothetical protein EPUL_003886 [Erysiphe pulchra]
MLLSSTSAAATRNQEATLLFQNICNVLDNALSVDHLPFHLHKPLRDFITDLNVVAQRHFDSHKNGTSRPMLPYAATTDKPNVRKIPASTTEKKVLMATLTFAPKISPQFIFELFKRSIIRAKNESEVVKYLVPILEGGILVENQGSKHITFSNLEPLTDANIEQRALLEGTPDRCYGSPFEQLCKEVREDLNSKVVPTAEKTNPIAPNFFLELKGPEGYQKTADLQAQHYEAWGERGQIALRSWGHDASVLDGKAHTIACTYFSRMLIFYSIHAVKSLDIDVRIEHFMHIIDGFFMDASVFNAIAAYQKLQDYAEEKRNEAIELANTRAQEIREASL